ncbi:hypothetical protein GUJ93_ZPchr0010g8980 [Zizania palustris]|uniref:PUM-HD domain-containing protein n=1 Tax=Zizania palustris TaxID=103762 RepID=A0A8J5W7Y8_ZIZPA|nr:hypothetical protein GUJ93_ZPchr0010g8980 [Zizania palustris]
MGDSTSCKIVDSDHQKVITNVDDVDRDNNNMEVQTQVPAQTRREPTYLELLLRDEDFELPPYINDQETNHYSSPTWIDQEPVTSNDVIETAELEPQEQITSAGAGSQFLVPLLVEVHQDSSQITGLNNDHLGVGGEKIKDPAENNSIRLINIMGYVAVLSVDPFGSHFIQQKLETATTTEIVMVYKEILPHVRILIIDVFANYAIQKLIEYGPTLFRRMLINTLAGSVVDLSLHQYGCQVIQKAFEVGDMDQRIEMADELGSFRGKAKTLSLHPYGCRVLQRVLHCCQDATIIHALVTEIIECIHQLSADQYGNYVVQDVLELGGEFVRSTFVMKFAGRIVDMSCHKYSSHVIEKCLSVGSCQDRLLIATEILRAGEDTLLRLMMDQHGNYVIQKVLETAEMWQCDMVVAAATRHVGMLTMYAPGRNVVAQVNKLLAARGRRAMQLLSAPTSPLYSHGMKSWDDIELKNVMVIQNARKGLTTGSGRSRGTRRAVYVALRDIPSSGRVPDGEENGAAVKIFAAGTPQETIGMSGGDDLPEDWKRTRESGNRIVIAFSCCRFAASFGFLATISRVTYLES